MKHLEMAYALVMLATGTIKLARVDWSARLWSSQGFDAVQGMAFVAFGGYVLSSWAYKWRQKITINICSEGE